MIKARKLQFTILIAEQNGEDGGIGRSRKGVTQSEHRPQKESVGIDARLRGIQRGM